MTDMQNIIAELGMTPAELEALALKVKEDPMAVMGLMQRFSATPGLMQKVMQLFASQPQLLQQMADKAGISSDMVATIQENMDNQKLSGGEKP